MRNVALSLNKTSFFKRLTRVIRTVYCFICPVLTSGNDVWVCFVKGVVPFCPSVLGTHPLKGNV